MYPLFIAAALQYLAMDPNTEFIITSIGLTIGTVISGLIIAWLLMKRKARR